MSKRHEIIGIKQAIRYEWMQKTVNLLFAGLDIKSLRLELHDYLSHRTGNGCENERGTTSRSQAVNMLMKIWVTPELELVMYRDDALKYLDKQPSMSFAVHWAMISAAYPFWFNVARQTGRLLNLQGQVTQLQIINRLREEYGDRQTVSRYARCAIRSFVAWGALRDLESKGCYGKPDPVMINDPILEVLLLEAALLAKPEGRGSLGTIMNAPSLFPFQLSALTAGLVSQCAKRFDVVRYGLDEDVLTLQKQKSKTLT